MDRKPTEAVPLANRVATKSMQAEHLMRVQVIRSKGQAPRFYVNIPLPPAAALDLQAGEEVQWQLLDRADLLLKRLAPAPASRKGSKT